MNTSHSVPENSIVPPALDQYVNGPYREPSSIPNATMYWRCTSHRRESIRKQDLYRECFHAFNCEVRR